MKHVTLITDGACIGNPGPGVWAALLRFQGAERLILGSSRATTNNIMELTAVLSGLRALEEPCEVLVITDSRYVMNAFDHGWLRNWQSNGWKTADGKPVKNKEVWLELLAETKRHTVRWQWVKGHAGHEDNERVDEAAQQAAAAAAAARPEPPETPETP